MDEAESYFLLALIAYHHYTTSLYVCWGHCDAFRSHVIEMSNSKSKWTDVQRQNARPKGDVQRTPLNFQATGCELYERFTLPSIC